MAAFFHQDIVGAAGGLRVHDFEADLRLRDSDYQAVIGKAELRAGAEQDDFGFVRQDAVEASSLDETQWNPG